MCLLIWKQALGFASSQVIPAGRGLSSPNTGSTYEQGTNEKQKAVHHALSVHAAVADCNGLNSFKKAGIKPQNTFKPG